MPVRLAHNRAVRPCNPTTRKATSAASSTSWSTAEHRVTTSTTPSSPRSIVICSTIRASDASQNSYRWRAFLDGTGEGVLQDVITDNCGNGHLVQIQFLVVPTIGRNLFSVKISTQKRIVSIFEPPSGSIWCHPSCYFRENTTICTRLYLTVARMATEQRSWQ